MSMTPATIASRDARLSGRTLAPEHPPLKARPERRRRFSAWLRRMRLRFRHS